MKINTCKIRRDLVKDKISVPIGSFYVSSDKEFEYKWEGEDEDEFYILLDGIWQEAESIDFDF